jgi:hypothetical protein
LPTLPTGGDDGFLKEEEEEEEEEEAPRRASLDLRLPAPGAPLAPGTLHRSRA